VERAFLAAVVLVLAVSAAGAAPHSRDTRFVSHRDGAGTALTPQGNGPAREPAVVLGSDERVRITDTDLYPYSAIAYLDVFHDTYLTNCTGTFIGPDVLLTAAHCLWDSEEGYAGDIIVTPGKSDSFEPFGSEFAYDWIVPQPWIDSAATDSLWDYGIVVMVDGALGNEVGWLPVGNYSTQTLARPDFQPAVVGYPGDIGGGTQMWGDSRDAFLAVNDYNYEYFIDTAAGQSGSAIFSTNDAEDFFGYIVGIHVSGGVTHNEGTRIESTTLADIIEWCSGGYCSVDYYTEGQGDTHTWGDIDCNGLTPVDALKILIKDGGGNPNTNNCPALGDIVTVNAVQIEWGDTDCNGLTPVDALKILIKDGGGNPNTNNCPALGDEVVLA